jgi:hypothetical protein
MTHVVVPIASSATAAVAKRHDGLAGAYHHRRRVVLLAPSRRNVDSMRGQRCGLSHSSWSDRAARESASSSDRSNWSCVMCFIDRYAALS